MSTNLKAASSNAVDLLEEEDRRLRRLFTELRNVRGGSVDERAVYGDLAKEIIRHMATREAAVAEVAPVVSDEPDLQAVAARLEHAMPQRRSLIDRVEKMSRGVQGINLNQGQDFDAELLSAIQVVGTEIEWELDDALPAIRGSIAGTDREAELKSAGHVVRHAPTNLAPGGPRWRERAPVVSRLIALYDHLRDFPRARHTR
jgi:hypothetical protein